MICRHCQASLHHVFLDLGFAPPSNAYLSAADLQAPELYFPLKLFVCDACWLVQTQDYARADELFDSDYAYFSSTSSGWLSHAAGYVEMVSRRLQLTKDSMVIEVASNDGYLLKNFVRDGIPCLGIEPTDSTARAAEALGIPVLRRFFGTPLAQELAREGKQADLIIGNNVYAHVPDINDFTAGLKYALKPGGTVTLEFPHLMRLIENAQFDTVYHEHFSYLSLTTASRIFESVGLRVFDVEELPTHGGSLRVYGCHMDDPRSAAADVARVRDAEFTAGLTRLDTYEGFQSRSDTVKNDFIAFLVAQKAAGRTVAAYGAAAKGNTLLNYGGVKPDLLPFVCDAAAAKQGKYLPGSHIPILSPGMLRDYKPQFVIVFPWNIVDEVMAQNSDVRGWGGKFVVAVPQLTVL